MRAATSAVTTTARRCVTTANAATRARAPLAVRATGAALANLHTQSFHAVRNEQPSRLATAIGAEPRRRFSTETQSPTDPEHVILRNALKHVPQHGWTIEALAAGATDMGYPSVAHGMFPRGAIELVDFFMDTCHDELRSQLVANTALLQTMSVADRLKFGVRRRLELLLPVKSTWPQAMALGALPQNAPTTLTKLAKLADEIWYFAGDQSTDASWYTKRALLTTIYASTELFLLSDTSPDCVDTWAFLDRRIDETIALGDVPQNLSDVTSMAGIALQSFVSAATSLAGPLGAQLVASSPLANVPNPIGAVGSVVPASVVSGLASAGFPPNPLASAAAAAPPTPFANDFDAKDLADLDAELEKLGGADTRRQ